MVFFEPPDSGRILVWPVPVTKANGRVLGGFVVTFLTSEIPLCRGTSLIRNNPP